MLSKSLLLAANQCQKRLWLAVNRPDLGVHPADVQRRQAQGLALNRVVHRLRPDGQIVDDTSDPVAATNRALAEAADRPLFEAAFEARHVRVRADVFEPLAPGYRLTEVKSSTRVKAHHLDDCAIQHWVIAQAGFRIDETVLAHVDRRFDYRGDGDYRGLLRRVDVGERIGNLLPQVPGWIDSALDTLSRTDAPAIAVGPHCTAPFSCPFLPHCRPPPVRYPVGALPGGGRIIDELRAEGIDDIRDIPDGRLHKPLHRRIRRATLDGRPFVDQALATTLRALPYPRRYLDFETIQFVVPRWPDTRPYEQLPFQWSCHIEPAFDTLSHREYLDTGGGPPLRRCAETLVDALGDQGPVFSYSAFEKTVIRRLAVRFPDLAPALTAAAERLFDLLPLVRAHYYHPEMKGSFSIKAVLPTIAPGLDYDSLDEEVRDGVAAQTAYETLIDERCKPERRRQLTEALRAYCRLDTLAMVRMVHRFERDTVVDPQ